tara:strand:- start:237 stop:428 length:192 start_codon:yes stop_codon:yes gene_type:complete
MPKPIKQEKICLNVSLRNRDLLDTIEYLQAETKLTKVDTIAQILRREKKAIETKKNNKILLGV